MRYEKCDAKRSLRHLIQVANWQGSNPLCTSFLCNSHRRPHTAADPSATSILHAVREATATQPAGAGPPVRWQAAPCSWLRDEHQSQPPLQPGGAPCPKRLRRPLRRESTATAASGVSYAPRKRLQRRRRPLHSLRAQQRAVILSRPRPMSEVAVAFGAMLRPGLRHQAELPRHIQEQQHRETQTRSHRADTARQCLP